MITSTAEVCYLFYRNMIGYIRLVSSGAPFIGRTWSHVMKCSLNDTHYSSLTFHSIGGVFTIAFWCWLNSTWRKHIILISNRAAIKLIIPRFTSYLNYLDIFVLRKSRQQLTSLQTRRTICIMSSYSRGWRDMQTCIRNYHNTSFYNLHNFYWVQFPLVGDCLRTFSWLKKSMFDILNLFHRSNISINLVCVIH